MFEEYWKEKITLETVSRECLQTINMYAHLPVLGSQKTQPKHWFLSLSHPLCTVPFTPTLPHFQMFQLIAFTPRKTASAQHEHTPAQAFWAWSPSTVNPCTTKLQQLHPGWCQDTLSPQIHAWQWLLACDWI